MFFFSLFCFFVGIYREELRGVSRGKDVKDVDWSKVAATLVDAEPVS